MIKTLRFISNYLDNVSEIAGRFASWFTTFLVLTMCYDVFMRYFLNTSSAMIIELEWHLFSIIFLFGAGYAFKYDRHVRVDVFYSNFSSKTKAIIDFTGTLIFLIPFCLIIVILSVRFAANSFAILETSPDPGGLPYYFIIKSAIPVGFTLLLLQAISVLCKSLIIIIAPAEPTINL
jgi:TRAP-type mannitol/chloroaromatic compound transport system permease small subunit